jgi:hypothetical protein
MKKIILMNKKLVGSNSTQRKFVRVAKLDFICSTENAFLALTRAAGTVIP